MSPVYTTIRKVSFRCLFVMILMLAATMQSGFASDNFSYNDVELRRIEAPANFENAVRYQITYWHRADGSSMRFSRAAKNANAMPTSFLLRPLTASSMKNITIKAKAWTSTSSKLPTWATSST